MSRLLVVVLFATVLTGCGQPKTDNEQQLSPQQAKINIPGTRLFITPPAGFTKSTSFVGLERGEQAIMAVTDLMAGNYYKNAATFNREGLEARGVQVFDFQETTIGGYPAKYLFLQPDSTTKSYWMVFGDSTFSTMLVASYPAAEEQTGWQLKQAMLAATYDKKLRVDPFATAPFTLDESQSKFKFALFSGNMYVYTIGGAKEQTKDQPDGAAITVTPIPTGPTTTATALADMMTESMENNGLTDKHITNISTTRLNGYDTYEADITGLMKGRKARLYELVVTNGSKSVAIQGILPPESTSSLQAIRDFAHTIKLK